MQTDMTSVTAPKSDQINADDLIGKTMTITITEVVIKGGQEQPVSIYFQGSDKAFRPCKSMCRVLVAIWGPDAKQYIGRSLTLYRDESVKWGGMAVGGIRISHASHIDGSHTMALTDKKGSRKPYTVKPLVVSAPAASAAPAIDLAAARLTLTTASAKGMKVLETAWLKALTAEQRKALKDELHTFKAKAEAYDASNQAPSPEPSSEGDDGNPFPAE